MIWLGILFFVIVWLDLIRYFMVKWMLFRLCLGIERFCGMVEFVVMMIVL